MLFIFSGARSSLIREGDERERGVGVVAAVAPSRLAARRGGLGGGCCCASGAWAVPPPAPLLRSGWCSRLRRCAASLSRRKEPPCLRLGLVFVAVFGYN